MHRFAPVLLLALSWAPTTVSSADPASPIATLTPGQQLEGVTKTLNTGEVTNIFYGVRFAEAPIGDKRFAQAAPAADWTGVRNAKSFGPKCMQTGADDESEDCLFLNVFTPSLTGSTAVMVFLHGGSYSTGSAGEFYYDGSTLARKGVVVVTVNYRLGTFGFLSTEDDVMPGNFAMLDQVEALKWVQKNIAAFGGDPGKVTIFGESAGAAIVSLQVLSPLSAGLFHRAIMESGSSLCVWAVNRAISTYQPRQLATELARRVGCPDSDSTSLLSCLRKADVKTIMSTSLQLNKEYNTSILLTPRVDSKSGFLPDYPERLLEKGTFNKVPTLRGYNSGEFAYVIQDDNDDGLTRDEFSAFYQKTYDRYSVSKEAQRNMMQTVNRHYLGNKTDPFAIRASLIDALTDMGISLPTVTEIEKTEVWTGPSVGHYLYELDYQLAANLLLQTVSPAWYRVIHGEDLQLVFYQEASGLMGLFRSQIDVQMADRVQTMWTNFAKFGDPVATQVDNGWTNIVWGRYTAYNPVMLKLDKTSTLVSYPRKYLLPLYDKILDYMRNETTTFPQL